MTIKRFIAIIILPLFFVGTINAQTSKTKNLPAFGVGAGILTFSGDLTNGAFTKIRAGYGLSLEQKIAKVLSISVNGVYGKVAEGGINSLNHLNFESTITQADLSLVFRLPLPVSPYISVGGGYMTFNSYGDLQDANGQYYYYWSDGTIKNRPENTVGSESAVEIKRDYKYESKLSDSLINYSRSTYTIPISIGVDVIAASHFSLRAGVTAYLTGSDWIDNYKGGKANDNFFYANISIKYHFSNTNEDDNSVNTKISEEDKDRDGVNDMDDMCPGTETGVAVNKLGCPIDTDTDGVPDYKDKEINSPPGSVVNSEGVKLTDEMIAKQNQEFNELATGQSKTYADSELPVNTSFTGKAEAGENLPPIPAEIPTTKPSQQQVKAATNGTTAISSKPQTSPIPAATTNTSQPNNQVKVLAAEQQKLNTEKIAQIKTKPISNEQNISKAKMPDDMKVFDKNNNGVISSEEINMGIDAFFEGENPSITIPVLNKLIDFYFEQ